MPTLISCRRTRWSERVFIDWARWAGKECETRGDQQHHYRISDLGRSAGQVGFHPTGHEERQRYQNRGVAQPKACFAQQEQQTTVQKAFFKIGHQVQFEIPS